MLRTIPGTVRGVGGSVVPSSLPANPVDHVIAPRRQFEILFATLLPKDVQVEVEVPDGRRFLMPRRRLQGRPALLAGLNAREAGDLLAREAHELVAFGRHIDGLDRKSTRLNSSHSQISYAVFCLKKKKKTTTPHNFIANSSQQHHTSLVR